MKIQDDLAPPDGVDGDLSQIKVDPSSVAIEEELIPGFDRLCPVPGLRDTEVGSTYLFIANEVILITDDPDTGVGNFPAPGK